MATALGKYLRKLRIDRDEKLYDMSKKLGVSAPFLSGVENGHKKASQSLLNKIIGIYNLSEEQQEELQYAQSMSLKRIDLTLIPTKYRELVILFAQKINQLTPEQIQQVKDLLKVVEK
ncbi:helix-turn-helix transcriptional regulator [Ligilactobacillus saerimneri]|uniref:helix-turn-helix domain-containing protein n=1 Tax=Ligilactobacillus saerimneri TaxID=228229 RepID=UPI0030CE0006